MAPIRVGIIGVGIETTPMSNGWWASAVHLPALLASPHYEVVALANSTIESAKASIAAHHLNPAEVKAYGSAKDIANDPEVDLVAVSVMAPRHFALAKEVILAGKDVFLESPLGINVAEAEELTRLAKLHNVKTIVGGQARASPLVLKVKEIIESGKIGKVLSSVTDGVFVSMPLDWWPESIGFWANIDPKGNILIHGHIVDSVTHILGPFKSFTSLLANEYPTVPLLNAAKEVVNPNLPKTIPDRIFMQGTLMSGVLVSITYHSASAGTFDKIAFRWTISGTEGEIQVTTPEMLWQYAGAEDGSTVKMTVKSEGEGGVVDVDLSDVQGEDYVMGIPFPGTNTARIWDAFAKGEVGRYPTFEDVWGIHKLLAAVQAGHL